MSIFLCSDLGLFDKDAAKEMNLSVEEYNNFLVNKFNERVGAEDLTVFNGIISQGYMKETASLFGKMNGQKESCDRKHNVSENLPKEFWEKNFVRITNIQGYTIREGKKILIINDFDLIKDLQEENVIAAAIPGSQIQWTEIYKNKILNSSIKNWNYYPIEIQEELFTLIDNMEIFEGMKDEEHTALWGEA